MVKNDGERVLHISLHFLGFVQQVVLLWELNWTSFRELNWTLFEKEEKCLFEWPKLRENEFGQALEEIKSRLSPDRKEKNFFLQIVGSLGFKYVNKLQ